jgi:hypothetical protein
LQKCLPFPRLERHWDGRTSCRHDQPKFAGRCGWIEFEITDLAIPVGERPGQQAHVPQPRWRITKAGQRVLREADEQSETSSVDAGATDTVSN